MQSILWDYNPIVLSLSGLASVGGYFFGNNVNKMIKKPNHQDIMQYRLVIFYMDGVLRKEDEPIPLAVETFNKLKKSGLPICIVTNNCRKSSNKMKKELRNMGFLIDHKIEMISSSGLVLFEISNILNKSILPSSKKKHSKLQPNVKFGVISDIDLYIYIKNNINSKFSNSRFYWIKDNIIPSDIDHIIVGTIKNDEDIIEYKNRAARWFICNPNASIIVSHPDTKKEYTTDFVYYSPMDLLPEIEVIGKKESEKFKYNDMNILGKPYCSKYIQKIKDKYDIVDVQDNQDKSEETNKSPILVVGDNIDTYIRFADNIGADKCLVLSGHTTIEDLEQNNNISENVNYLIPDISYLTF